MSYNDAGPFTVMYTGTVHVNNRAVTCPSCGCIKGLALLAQSASSPVVASCPAGHSWQVNGISFAQVRDTYLASQGLPPHRDDARSFR